MWPDTFFFLPQRDGKEAAAGSDRERGRGRGGVSSGLLTNLEGTVAHSDSAEAERERESVESVLTRL